MHEPPANGRITGSQTAILAFGFATLAADSVDVRMLSCTAIFDIALALRLSASAAALMPVRPQLHGPS